MMDYLKIVFEQTQLLDQNKKSTSLYLPQKSVQMNTPRSQNVIPNSMNWIFSRFPNNDFQRQRVLSDGKPGVCVLAEPLIVYKPVLCTKYKSEIYAVTELEIPSGAIIVRPKNQISNELYTSQAILRSVKSLHLTWKHINEEEKMSHEPNDIYKYVINALQRPVIPLNTNIYNSSGTTGIMVYLTELDAINNT